MSKTLSKNLNEKVPNEYPLLKDCLMYLNNNFSLYSTANNYILNNFDDNYYLSSEELLRIMMRMTGGKEGLMKSLDSLVQVSRGMMLSQARLKMNGKYEFSSFEEVNANFYQNKDVIIGHMDALLISQVFWPNHYKFGQFFIYLSDLTNSSSKVLDIPSGDGIFSYYLSKCFSFKELHCVDISSYCIDYTKKFLEASNLGTDKIYYMVKDVFDFSESEVYDFIVCGELLEHVENPERLLGKLKTLTNNDGRIFLTTAIFSASEDHIYLFNNVDEVRDMINNHFVIESELILPSSLKDYDPSMEKEAINYACVVRVK